MIWIHVDDGIVTGPDNNTLRQLERDLASNIKIKWSDQLNEIVGLNVTRDDNGFELSQPKLIMKILDDHWDGVSMARTPLPTGNLPTTNDSAEGVRSSEYLSIIGSLSYLAVGTRPDITFAVNFLARFSSRPSITHWKCLNNLVNYVASTKDQKLDLKPKEDSTTLCCFVDANWGGEFSRSTYGLILFLNGCPIAWYSKRMATVASSTAHAEYMALGHGTKQILWIKNLLKDIAGIEVRGVLYCDNQAAVKIGSNDASNKRTRHTDREFYITNQAFFEKKTTIEWVPTRLQFADILTKNLSPASHDFQSKVIQGAVSSNGGGVVVG
jgi:hypothetical protein